MANEAHVPQMVDQISRFGHISGVPEGNGPLTE